MVTEDSRIPPSSIYALLPVCAVGDREVSAIGKGLCVLLGISRYDTVKEAEWM